MNKCMLIGRLGKDPELKCLPNGKQVANVSLATSSKYTSKTGEKVEKTEWHNLTFFDKLADIAGKYLKKGSQIYAEGEISTRKWQDNEGNTRYSTSITVRNMEMLGGTQVNQQVNQQDAQQAEKYKQVEQADNFLDDDIPF